MICTDTQKIAKQFQLTDWANAVRERINSGQSVRAFCRDMGIYPSTYYYRQRKVRETACAMLELEQTQKAEPVVMPDGWVRLAEPKTTNVPGGALAIEVGGCCIRADAGTDLELLAKVCRVLRAL